jgi:hypothetical protein
MSTENNPYLTVPDYGQLNQNFGKEKLYSGYTAPSAVSDLAAAAAAANLQTGARTPDKGKYVYDPKTGQYIWVPATAAAAANTGLSTLPAYQDRDGGGRGELGPQTNWGEVLGKPELTGKTFQELTQEEQDEASAIVDPYGIGKGIQSLVSNSTFGKVATTVGDFFDKMQGKNLETGGWNTGFNEGTLGTGVSTQSQDAATNAAVEGRAQANAANTLGVNDAAVNAATNSAQAQANAVAEGNKGENQGGSYGVTDSGYGMTPDGGIDGSMFSRGGIAALAGGGLGNLGGYSDGGRLLRGPGDGVSDSIPASIGGKRPARLADGEFVVPARIVSELGNGSTEAGARKLYAMLDRIQAGRKKTVGKGKVATNSRADKNLPA